MARTPFDSLTLRAVTYELSSLLIGGQIQHIRTIGPNEAALHVRAQGHSRRLALSADAEAARLHLITGKLQSGSDADHFTMALRKHIEGGRIADCRQVGFDRIAQIVVENHGCRYTLVSECMGKHSNVLLVDADGVILDCIRHVGASSNRLRLLLPGQPYIRPPGPSGAADLLSDAGRTECSNAASVPPTELAAWFQQRFVGMSPFLSRELACRCSRDGPEAAWDAVAGRAMRNAWEPVTIRDRNGRVIGAYPLRLASLDADLQHPAASVNDALAALSASRSEHRYLAARRVALLRDVSAARAAREARLADARRAIEARGQADELARHADLLLACGGAAEPIGGKVVLPDLYRPGEQVEVTLKPGLGIAENAEALYRRARKLRSAAEWADRHVVSLMADAAALREAEAALTEDIGIECLSAVENRLRSLGLLPVTGGQSRDAEGRERTEDRALTKGVRELDGPLGWRILMGLNAEGNDTMLRRLCRPNDVWFHVRAHASAHVVVRNPDRKADLPLAVLEYAARLAARSSKAKHSSVVSVDYTFCKFVRRPRGAAHGRVTYSNERTIDVEPRTES